MPGSPRARVTMQIFDSPDSLRLALGHGVATIGKYDGMHLGHQSILEAVKTRAAALGLPSIVILSEPQPEEFFAPDTAPARLNDFDDKVDFLAGFGLDAVLRMHFDATVSRCPAERFVSDYLLDRLGLRVLIVGDDFRFGQGRRGDFTLLRELAADGTFEVASVGPCLVDGERVSSTRVRHCLAEGDCATVTRLLGRPYSMGGPVVRGRQLGRQLGVPTANLALQRRTLPTSGVFAVHVECEGAWFRGVANLGFKPTVEEVLRPSLEVHLFDVAPDLYDRRLRVHFLHKLRDEQRFPSLDALKAQIARDLDEARAFLSGLSLPESGTAGLTEARA